MAREDGGGMCIQSELWAEISGDCEVYLKLESAIFGW